ncbi:MarR family transcriptional regulator [uncultured Cohaesibacter sp.]|uniref:MarR family winged helix-turn-helix transcriptional regulator n=1 Tax=uncultured Cohaesibacter sp. TaxID=1002546 RepID=UPI00292FEF6B|nr:MarR family transcriptional regulator [uncultured Cohaesibacter sp.]
MDKPNEVGFVLKQINDKMQQLVNHQLLPFGLTMTQAKFLGFLRSRQSVVTSQKDFETHFDIAHTTAIGVLRRLEQKGLIEIVSDPDDKRRRLVNLLPAEDEIHSQVVETKRRIDKQMTKNMSEDQVRELESRLLQLHQNLLELDE